MAETGKQSPLGVNLVSSLLLNEGLSINPVTTKFLGSSKTNPSYTPGSLVNDTCLKWLTYAINDAYNRGAASGNPSPTVDTITYNNLINIGQSRITALGNSKPPTYISNDPSDVWHGEATSGYGLAGPNLPSGAANPGNAPGETYTRGQGQGATWYPWNSTWDNVSVTQWGFLRCLALQAWNAFNWNGVPDATEPEYKNYTQSFLAIDGFIKFSNESIMTLRNSVDFLDGTYSNMNDLISADITGVSLSTQAFGQDLVNLGKALNLNQIMMFGMPSVLLRTLQDNSALTQPLILALIVAGLSQDEITSISQGEITPTFDQQTKIYAAMLVIIGEDLNTILKILECKTSNLIALADLLNVKKMFPISYTTLTVPIYNTTLGPTNSKTYYLLFVENEMNPQLIAPKVKAAIGPIVPPLPPPIVDPPPPLPVIEEKIIEEIPIPPLPYTAPILEYYVEETKPPPTVEEKPPIEIPIAYGQRQSQIEGPRFGGGGGCVTLNSFVPHLETEMLHNGRVVTNAWMLEPDMKILLGTESLKNVEGKVKKVLNDQQPCVRILTKTGVSLVCSTTARLFTKEDGFALAPEILGKHVAVMKDNVNYFDEVVEITERGLRFVRVIDAYNNSFWAGEYPNMFILHHNVPINDDLNIAKN